MKVFVSLENMKFLVSNYKERNQLLNTTYLKFFYSLGLFFLILF
jgi:hypothetical protein